MPRSRSARSRSSAPTVVAAALNVFALGKLAICDARFANIDSVVRAFLVEESKIVKNVLKSQQAKASQ